MCRKKIKLGTWNITLNFTKLPHDKHTKTTKYKVAYNYNLQYKASLQKDRNSQK